MTAITMPAERRPAWRGLLGFNLLTGIVGAIVGWLFGDWIGGRIHAASIAYYATESGQNDISILLGYLFGVIGFLAGLGFLNYPIRRIMGYPPSLAEHESEASAGGPAAGNAEDTDTLIGAPR